ncbi:hypothetical protein [uncultured Gammaproteobacteria bacterium]|nr:hypothetical protein [uncultured Gammaproteobacteria bacterium]CAC9980278.1 hypothetical protein [uncultured Gammaproteobacteria bacterium]
MSKNNTTVAIVYDFDGTLAKGNIQENSFIPNLGVQKNYKTPTISDNNLNFLISNELN